MNIQKVIQFNLTEWLKSQKHCDDCYWRGICGGLCPAVMSEYGKNVIKGRCKFSGALRDAVFSFLVDKKIMYNPDIDQYLSYVKKIGNFKL